MTDFDRRWDRHTPERLRDLQDRKLRRFLREQLLAFSPFYRRLFAEHGIDPRSIRSVEDLEKVPFTSKEDVAPTREDTQRPRNLVLAPSRELIGSGWPLSRKASLALT